MGEDMTIGMARAGKRGVRATDVAALIGRCQEGDRSAFEELIQKYEGKVFGLIYQIVRSVNAVDDIAQEVFTNLYFSLPQFQPDVSGDAWLYRIMLKQCQDYLCKQERNPRVTDCELSEGEAFLEPRASIARPRHVDIAKKPGLRQTAENLLTALPPRERMLLTLKEIEELSVEELTKVFNTSRSVIELRLFRARRLLKSAYEKRKKRQRK